MKSIRALLLLGMLGICWGIHAQPHLNMYVTTHRYLDSNHDTVLYLDYQIPYRSLSFVAQHGGFFAEVNVTILITDPEGNVYQQEVSDNIGISSKHDSGSIRKSYLNRLSFKLDKDQYSIEMKAVDPNSGKEFSTAFQTTRLSSDAKLSDIELNVSVTPDTLSYLRKFHRQGKLYEPLPSVLFSKSESDNLYLYFEIYSTPSELKETQLLMLSLEQDSVLVMDEYIDFSPRSNNESITLKIPLDGLNLGKYLGSVSLQTNDTVEYRYFEFVLTEEQDKRFYVFADMENEYSLLRYFLGSRMPANWSSMNQPTKERYVSGFWMNLAAQLNQTPESTVSLIQQRIDYANRHYSHHKPGWTTDMGRIYIRNGAPAEIETGTSSDDSRFVRKDYQIWKYQGGDRAVYLFIDTQMSNNFRLFYVSGDTMESSNPDWMRYVGSDFDTSILRN